MEKLKVYTTTWCPDCSSAKRFLKSEKIEFEEINIETDAEAVKLVQSANEGKNRVPTFEKNGKFLGISPFNKAKLVGFLNSF